jgi:hypothetical protein
MQARRTGTSSALGMIFDHGCDAINSIVGALNMLMTLRIPLTQPVGVLIAMATPFVPFYVATWEEYYVGQLVLPPINGPSEGVLIGVGIGEAPGMMMRIRMMMMMTTMMMMTMMMIMRGPRLVSSQSLDRVIIPSHSDSGRACHSVGTTALVSGVKGATFWWETSLMGVPLVWLILGSSLMALSTTVVVQM